MKTEEVKTVEIASSCRLHFKGDLSGDLRGICLPGETADLLGGSLNLLSIKEVVDLKAVECNLRRHSMRFFGLVYWRRKCN